jgi:gliding motility-associated-like protein
MQIKPIVFLFFFLNFSISGISQTNFYSDICKCGVTGAGFSTSLGSGEGQIKIHIEPGSLIKKAFLFGHRYGLSSDTLINFNNNLLLFDDQSRISEINFSSGTFLAKEQAEFAIDVTEYVSVNQTDYPIEVPHQASCDGCSFNNFYLFIIYENQSFSHNTAFYILINNKNESNTVSYEFNDMNSILNNSPNMFAINTDRIGDNFPFDGSVLKMSNIEIGLVKGTDSINENWGGAGVKGHFYYQNNQGYGLDDDDFTTPINGTDGIMNVQNYIQNNSLNWSLSWELQNSNGQYNIYQGFYIAHSTPCAPFDVTVTPDTVVCLGSSIQLSATGGTAYEWQPATGLSCTHCSNPIATLDSSQLYTVRIWNNDSCSVVRPVKVNVRELPAFQSVNPVATACGTETGGVVVVANNATAKPLSYSLNGGAFETSSTFTGEFTELGAGTYTITLQDAYGCQRDTVFSVVSNNTTQAQFTANPQSGAAPLEVSFTNTSTNATNYEWFVTSGTTSTSQGTSLSTLTFDTSGVYTVTLVAWQNSSACADTFSLQILVFDTLLMQIPNVFTPNNDGANDVFSITSNLPASYTFTLLNRWGTVVASKKSTFTPNVPEFLWDGKNATDGTYFYTLEVEWQNETKKVEGFVVKIDRF